MQGLGILAADPTKKGKRHFMDRKNTLLNEVIGIRQI